MKMKLEYGDPFLGLKLAVKGAYTFQEDRVAQGNRVVAHMKVKLGYEPGTKEEDTMDKKGKEILDTLEKNYKKITESIGPLKNALPNKKLFKKEGLIDTYAEGILVHQFVLLEKAEKESFKRIEELLEEHPLWTTFLSDVKGCGPAIAGAIISSIDITKAEYPSSLWKYCGFDVVRVGRLKKKALMSTNNKDVEDLKSLIDDKTTVLYDKKEALEDLGVTSMEDLIWTWEGRGRKKGHMVNRSHYDAENDEWTHWQALSYNPWIKSKLWLLSGNFLRSKNVEYSEIYYNRKNRSENHPNWKTRSKGHIHEDALRFTIKRFLVDLYKAWRPLEGLPVAPEYSEAKLGLIHKSSKKYAKAT